MNRPDPIRRWRVARRVLRVGALALTLPLPWQAAVADAPFSSEHVVTTLADGTEAAIGADLDRDGDLDLISADSAGNRITWYENDPNDTGARGTFGAPQIITTATDHPSSLFAADVDGDGDLDLLSASRLDNKVAWYDNTDGAWPVASW